MATDQEPLIDLVLFTVQENGVHVPPEGGGFMPRDMAGKWTWCWALNLVQFIPKGARKAPDNRPWHLSFLTDDHNFYKAALLRALRCEADRIRRLDLPIEMI